VVGFIAERGFGIGTKEHKPNLADTGGIPAMSQDFLDHDASALLQRKTSDTGAYGGKGDRPQPAQVGDLKAAASGAAQAVRSGPASQPHARGMDDEARR